MLGGGVGPHEACRHEPQHRRAIDDAAMTLLAHDRQNQAGEFVPAEEIGLEELADVLGRHVLEGAGLAVGAVVEQRVELAAGALEHFFDPRRDGGAVGEVEAQRLQPLAGEAVGVLLPAARGKDAPAAVLVERAGAVIADARRAAGDQDGARWHLHPRPGRRARDGRLQCLAGADGIAAAHIHHSQSPNSHAAGRRWPRFRIGCKGHWARHFRRWLPATVWSHLHLTGIHEPGHLGGVPES